MKIIEAYQCDVCGISKKEANHWWRGYSLGGGGVLIVPWDRLPFERLAPDQPVAPQVHLCGEQHALKWASENLNPK